MYCRTYPTTKCRTYPLPNVEHNDPEKKCVVHSNLHHDDNNYHSYCCYYTTSTSVQHYIGVSQQGNGVQEQYDRLIEESASFVPGYECNSLSHLAILTALYRDTALVGDPYTVFIY